MIKIDNWDVYGWEAAIRGMRNPMNSWDKSDSYEDWPEHPGIFHIGPNDLSLMKRLSKAGNDHAKYMRMINVTMDIVAPLYYFKELETYKVGTVSNSCSTMHKIHEKEFTLSDFSYEHLLNDSLETLRQIIRELNIWRYAYLNGSEWCEKHNKEIWWQMIQLLPSSYNQRRTIQLNYQVLKSMYWARKDHKLDEWRDFCEWTLTLPYFKELCVDVYE